MTCHKFGQDWTLRKKCSTDTCRAFSLAHENGLVKNWTQVLHELQEYSPYIFNKNFFTAQTATMMSMATMAKDPTPIRNLCHQFNSFSIVIV